MVITYHSNVLEGFMLSLLREELGSFKNALGFKSVGGFGNISPSLLLSPDIPVIMQTRWQECVSKKESEELCNRQGK